MRHFKIGILTFVQLISAPLVAQTPVTQISSAVPAAEPAVSPLENGNPAAPEPAAACCVIPALTLIKIEILSTINSQANKIGETFPIRLTEPIMIDGKVLVPAGTKGSGDVVHAAKSRFGGRPGELIIAVRYLEHDGQRIPLRSLRFSSATGNDKGTSAMAAGAVGGAVGGVVAMFITGGEVNIPAGSVAEAKVSAATVIKESTTTQGSEAK